MNMTHPIILETERDGMPSEEPEMVKCPMCEEMVAELICCEWQCCENKCCHKCADRYFDPVLGDRNRMDTFLVCTECGEALEEIAEAKECLRKERNAQRKAG